MKKVKVTSVYGKTYTGHITERTENYITIKTLINEVDLMPEEIKSIKEV